MVRMLAAGQLASRRAQRLGQPRSPQAIVGLALALGMLLMYPAAVLTAPITIGSPMPFPIPEESRVLYKTGAKTIANVRLGEPGALAASPISGTIVRWRLAGN